MRWNCLFLIFVLGVLVTGCAKEPVKPVEEQQEADSIKETLVDVHNTKQSMNVADKPNEPIAIEDKQEKLETEALPSVDLCENITCEAKCESNVRLYSGQCVSGQCEYSEEICADTCENAQCKADLCRTVICENICSNGNSYTQKCFNGQCIPDQLTEACSMECSNGKCIDNCQIMEKNGAPENKINLYFYEDGYNDDIEQYYNRVQRYVSVLFGGQLDGSNFAGTDPFNQLKSEFNIYSYADTENQYDGEYLKTSHNQPSTIRPLLGEKCNGFSENNYDIVIVLGLDTQLYASGSASQDFSRSSQGIVKLGYDQTAFIYMPPYGDSGQIISHELAHYIGFLEDEYDSMSLYLGGRSFAPNLDSASCSKWCQGADTSSACYQKYADWLSCFKNDFILAIPEMQNVFTQYELNYNDAGYDWWGVCFNNEHWFTCGSGIQRELHKKILESQEKDAWMQKWMACRNKAQLDCNIGLNCANNQGCYVRDGFATFTPTVGSIMEDPYNINNMFNPVSKTALMNNIQNKDKTIEINVIPFTI